MATGWGGSIVDISSSGGKCMPARAAADAASKTGIHALTAAMAQELGAGGIRVNAIRPGIIDTDRVDDIPRGPARHELIEKNVPLDRAGSGEDIAWTVV